MFGVGNHWVKYTSLSIGRGWDTLPDAISVRAGHQNWTSRLDHGRKHALSRWNPNNQMATPAVTLAVPSPRVILSVHWITQVLLVLLKRQFTRHPTGRFYWLIVIGCRPINNLELARVSQS